MSEDDYQQPSDSTASSPRETTASSDSSTASASRKVVRKRIHLQKLNNRRGKRHLDPSTSTKAVRKNLSLVEELSPSADLDIPPLSIPDDDEEVVEPSPSTAGDDEFTTRWYQSYHDGIAKKSGMAYNIRGVVSDAFYIHMVKELLHPGHLADCGIARTNLRM